MKRYYFEQYENIVRILKDRSANLLVNASHFANRDNEIFRISLDEIKTLRKENKKLRAALSVCETPVEKDSKDEN